MTLALAWSAALACGAVLALFLARRGLGGRLFFDALCIGATLGATVALALVPFALKDNPHHFSPAARAFLFAGLPEEGVKLLGAAAFLRGHVRARCVRDLVLAAGALSLGFGQLETLFYVAPAGPGWAAVAWARALTALPFHVMLGLAGGYAIARAPRGAAGWALVGLAWAGLAGVHGLYDYGVFVAGGYVDTSYAMMICAQAAAALAAAWALRAAGAPPEGRWRALGWTLTASFGGGALAALVWGALVAYALDSASAFSGVAAFAVSPLAVGALSLPAWRPWPRRSRPALAVGALAALAALIWGPAGWRKLDGARAQAQGARLAAAGDYARAAEAFGRAAALAPGDVEPLALRGRAYAAARRFEAALADLDAALRIAPRSAALHTLRADVNRRRNAPAAALADLEAAVALAPDDPALLTLRGQAKLENGDSKGAYADLAQASRRAPDGPMLRRIFAAWDVDAGDFDAALRDLNARLHDAPGDLEAVFQRGRVWFYKREFARARADFALAAPQGLYPAIWRALADARLPQSGDAALRGSLDAAPPGWPAPVARLLLGEIDFAAARAQAGDDDQRCEADFYFAASRLGLDPSQTSAERLRAALAECPSSFVEFEGAKALLRRLAL